MFARCLASILGIVPSSGEIMITIEMLQILRYIQRWQPLSRKELFIVRMPTLTRDLHL